MKRKKLRRTYHGTALTHDQWRELKLTGCVVAGDEIIRTLAFIKRSGAGARKEITRIAGRLFREGSAIRQIDHHMTPQDIDVLKLKGMLPDEARQQMQREGWASLEAQQAHWSLDKTEATSLWFDHDRIEDARTEAALDAMAEREERVAHND